MMKSTFIALFIVFQSSILLKAQEKLNIGASYGTSYYMGDINPYKVLYAPSTSNSGMIIWNFNNRYSWRTNIRKMQLVGRDADFDNPIQQIRNVSFQASLLDLNTIIEFNFLPYDISTKFKNNFSFFVSGGLGYAIVLSNNHNSPHHLTIPLGIGVKYNIIKRLTLGAEWVYYKTFNDVIDGVVNNKNSLYSSSIHNKDWYSFAGVFVAYQLFNNENKCPVYE